MLLICYIYIEQYHYYFLYQCSTGQIPIYELCTFAGKEVMAMANVPPLPEKCFPTKTSLSFFISMQYWTNAYL